MGTWSRSVQAFGALPDAEALVTDPRPAWIWARDGSRILWANLAGGCRLAARGMDELSARRYPDSHPLRRELQKAAATAPPGGTLARLRLPDSPRAVPLTCRICPIAAENGEEGILVVADAPDATAPADPAAASAFFEPVEQRTCDGAGKVTDGDDWSEAGEAPAPGAPLTEAVRSPIPEWLRARLATFPARAHSVQAQASRGRRPEIAVLSPQERAAFEEIAAALGPHGGDAASRLAGVQANDNEGAQRVPEDGPVGKDAAAGRESSDIAGQQPKPHGDTGFAPSAFFVPVPQSAAAAPPGSGETTAARLREAEERVRELSSVLDVATDGVVILDAEGRIESLNGSAEALFCVRQSEVVGRPFTEFLAPDSRPVAMRYFDGLKTGGVAGLINEGRELEAQADGGTVPLFVTFGRIGGDKADRFCAVLRDLTQWKRAEADLVEARRKAEQASSQKSDFLARVSHEIRTPLNGIIGFADVILEERFGPMENERYREYVRDISKSGEHVLSLVNDLLDIAKIEAGKLELNFAPVQLNELARECILLMQPAAGRARIILRSSLSAGVPPVRADPRTIRQVLLNLLSNSVKFTQAGGQVIVSTGQAPDGAVILRVRDTGDGMTESDLVRALEPFGQLSTAALASRMGTGLGLPLTKALVEANRASFAITSAKGEGTIVKVTFPSACVVDPS